MRIDSGDLAVLAQQVRRQLDDLGATKTQIVVSSDLDEFAIAALRSEPIDTYGVGTSVVTGSGRPTAEMVYKLVEVEGRGVSKRSRNKKSHGGAKRGWRAVRPTGTAVEELITHIDAPAPLVDELEVTSLTVPLMRNGRRCDDLPQLEDSRQYLARALVTLPWEGLALTEDDPAIPTRFIGL